jgi:2-methylaconitate cis-trans-isomerase PrpF
MASPSAGAVGLGKAAARGHPRIGHSTALQVETEIEKQNDRLELTKATLVRTARLLVDGNVYIRSPRHT